MIDRDTQDWIRTPADELAAKAGMRFDGERGEFAVSWIESHCRLYEGERAGEPMILLAAWREFFMRLYGWVRWSDEWNRWLRRFTHATFLGAKKNGKSPNCAAHNLYLLAGDGEPGQKVYQAAANGEQARIAQMHAINMVKQSPRLAGECKINNSTLSILHLPSNSTLTILTGDDSRGAKAKEGLNGSVSYDEMHVVNREIEERTSRAGISRAEPLNCAFSTAGDDPSAVGAERFNYGRQVNAGERADPHFLHVEYTAPGRATNAEIEENLEEYGRMANPCWGDLVKPSEFRADWNRSKGRPREEARFKQYRLNIEVGSTNPWLDTGGWQLGATPFTLADCAGRDCFMSADLARKLDMASVVFTFPWPEDGPDEVRVFPLFWIPEATAKERDVLFPLLTWGAAGDLKITPGETLDYDAIEADVRDAIGAHNLNVVALYYDEHYANEFSQRLREGHDGLPGVVAERFVFKQSLMYFTGPSVEFERRVKAGSVQHPDNAVLNWQVGHCQVWSDRNQNIRPVKPPKESKKNIDGVVCCVMTMPGVTSPPEDSTIPPLMVFDL